MICSQCQSENTNGHKFCHACGNALAHRPDVQNESNQTNWEKSIDVPWGKLGLGLAGLSFLFVCFFHIVWINGVPTPVKRLSPGLSEPMSSIEAISGMPWIAAVSQYPLTVQALQQAGYLESDAARQDRVSNEVNSKIEAEMQKIRDQLGY